MSTAKVYQFKKKEEIDEVKNKATGDAFCIQCNHKWVAIADVGDVQLECPNCKTYKGLFAYPFNLSEGRLVRECNCGNQLFYLTPEGHLCPNCGTYKSY